MGGGILVNLKKISILDTQANYKLEGDTPKEMKMQAGVILTVAESKRLIAQGVAALLSVQKATQDGLVVISTSTTKMLMWQKRS